MGGKARPLSVLVAAGQTSDPTYLIPLLDAVRVGHSGPGCPRKRPTTLQMDYGAREYQRVLRARKIRCICPERTDAHHARLCKGSHRDGLRNLTHKPIRAARSWNAASAD